MKRDVAVHIADILEAIARIGEYVGASGLEAFKKDGQLQDAVIRRLEIIGEAVKGMPQSIKSKHTTIPWKEIAGMRDVLIHAYFGVNIERVWKVIKDDLPELKKELERIKRGV